MSFDPVDYSVRKASEKLGDLSLDDLEEVLDLELDGKHRSSLIAEIGRSIDALKTADEAREETEPVEEAPKLATIDEISYYRLGRQQRKSWSRRSDGRFEK